MTYTYTPTITNQVQTGPNNIVMSVQFACNEDGSKTYSKDFNIGEDFTDDQDANALRVLEIINLEIARQTGADEQQANQSAQATDVAAFFANPPIPLKQPVDLSPLDPPQVAVRAPSPAELAAQQAAEAAAQAQSDYATAENLLKAWKRVLDLGIIDASNPDYQAALKDAQSKFLPSYVAPAP